MSRILVLGVGFLQAFCPVALLVVPEPGGLFALYGVLLAGAAATGVALRRGWVHSRRTATGVDRDL